MFKFLSILNRKIAALSLSLLSLGVFAPHTVKAAENIFFVYSPAIVSLPIESLEKFAQDGIVDQNLEFYINLAKVNEEQKVRFREALTKPVEVDPVLLSRSLNADIIQRLLDYFGTVINIRGGGNGKFALRGAIIQASFSDEGLTLLGVLQNLAVDIQVDIEQIFEYGEHINLVIQGSELFIQEIQALEQKEVNSLEAIYFSQRKDIRLLGSSKYTKSTLNFHDTKRDRKFYVELYQPTELEGENIPVIIFSHGLSSHPKDYASLAIHLASNGYVVAMPQHPGSDILRTKDFLAGLTREYFDLNEFIDRPADISYVIDELTRRNKLEFDNKLDLENVGVGGHSFGGYTALAVAGAQIDFPSLKRNCDLAIGNLNMALLLQCEALKLDQTKEYNFRDSRVKAVFVSNPVNASIFHEQGLSQVKIPTFFSAGSYDLLTPFVFEQGRSFPFLGSQESYLQLQEGQAHDARFSDFLRTVTNLTLPTPDLLDDYTNSMTYAFFQVHLRNQKDYKNYLKSSYAEYLSQGQDFKTYVITDKSAPALKQKYDEFIEQNQDLILRDK